MPKVETWFDTVLIAVEGSGPTGGAERVAYETIELLSMAGYRVHIISTAKAIDDYYLNLPGVTGDALDLPTIWDSYFSRNRILSYPERRGNKALIPRYNAILESFDPSTTILHVHGFHSYFSHLLIEVALGRHLKVHLHAHDYGAICPNATLFHYPSNQICRLKPLSTECRNSDCLGKEAAGLKQLRFWRTEALFSLLNQLSSILCPSPFAANILRSQLPGNYPIEVLCCPVEPATTEQCKPWESNIYLWIGRLTKEKNLEIALKAANEAGITLTVAGEGPLRADLETRYPKHRFLGWKSTTEISKLQSSARCLIMSSAWYETASLVVLESLGAGIPCIVAEESAATSWITAEENGLTFKNGNESSLAAAIARTKDDSFVRLMSDNAYSRYQRSPLSKERYLSELLNVYSAI